MRAAGVDLSGRWKGTTALAIVEGRPRPRLVAPPRERGLRGKSGDQTLLSALVDASPDLVALDAPLQLPHLVTCRDQDCARCFPDDDVPAYGTRQLERAESWRGISATMKSPMPMVMIAAIAFRAIYLRWALRRQGLCAIETWPTGVYRVLQARRGGGFDAKKPIPGHMRHELLAHAIDGMEHLDPATTSDDALDATAAAYASWCKAADAAKRIFVGEFEDEGEIWVPA